MICACIEAYAGMGKRRRVNPRKYDMSRAMDKSNNDNLLTSARVEAVARAMMQTQEPVIIRPTDGR